MGIATAFTTLVGVLSSPTAIAGTTLLTGANTVMNAVELKNDSDIKAGINNANSKLVKVQDSLDELQGICANTCTMDDIESMFAAPAAPASTPTAPASTQTPAAPTAPAQSHDNNVPPVWAQQIMQQQMQQAEVIKNLMQQQNTANAAPSNTTVNVNPATTPTPTTAPAAPAATTTPASTPAPQPTGESALDAKLDKLIEGFAAFVDSFNQQANSGSAPAANTGSSDTAKTGA